MTRWATYTDVTSVVRGGWCDACSLSSVTRVTVYVIDMKGVQACRWATCESCGITMRVAQ